MLGTDLGALLATLGNATTRSRELDIKVHTINTGGRIVFDSQIDMFGDSESEGSVFREVVLVQLVLLHFQTLFQNFLGLLASDCDGAGDLLITTDTEISVRKASLSKDGLLLRQLLQHLRGTSKSIAGFTNTDIQGEFFNSDLAHRIIVGHFR